MHSDSVDFDKKGGDTGSTYLNSFSSTSSSLNPLDHWNELNNFRVLKNLGSRVLSVIPFDGAERSGF